MSEENPFATAESLLAYNQRYLDAGLMVDQYNKLRQKFASASLEMLLTTFGVDDVIGEIFSGALRYRFNFWIAIAGKHRQDYWRRKLDALPQYTLGAVFVFGSDAGELNKFAEKVIPSARLVWVFNAAANLQTFRDNYSAMAASFANHGVEVGEKGIRKLCFDYMRRALMGPLMVSYKTAKFKVIHKGIVHRGTYDDLPEIFHDITDTVFPANIDRVFAQINLYSPLIDEKWFGQADDILPVGGEMAHPDLFSGSGLSRPEIINEIVIAIDAYVRGNSANGRCSLYGLLQRMAEPPVGLTASSASIIAMAHGLKKYLDRYDCGDGIISYQFDAASAAHIIKLILGAMSIGDKRHGGGNFYLALPDCTEREFISAMTDIFAVKQARIEFVQAEIREVFEKINVHPFALALADGNCLFWRNFSDFLRGAVTPRKYGSEDNGERVFIFEPIRKIMAMLTPEMIHGIKNTMQKVAIIRAEYGIYFLRLPAAYSWLYGWEEVEAEFDLCKNEKEMEAQNG